MNWNDLTVFLEIARGGSLARAARVCRVDKTTVARRLGALESALGSALVERDGRGRLRLTPEGQRVAREAERMEDASRRIVSGPAKAPAKVRLTAVPLVTNHMILPLIDRLCPDIALELIAEAQDLSLAQHDADIAVRLARPREGGQQVLARRLGVLEYAAYRAADAPEDLPWIGYDTAMQYLSHAEALETLAAAPGQQVSRLAVNDAETLYQAVSAGMGQSLFPRRIAGSDPSLTEVPLRQTLPSREVWLLVRRDLRGLTRIAKTISWLEEIFADPAVSG